MSDSSSKAITVARGQASHAVDVLAEFGHRSARGFMDRVRRVRASLLIAVQAAIAAGIAWYLAHNVIGHVAPFFAPISAVIVLAVAVGQRLRRAVELVVGVALGIFVGDLLIYFIGTGLWQISVAVLLAILSAVFVGGSATVIGQAASSAVLVATLQSPTIHGIYYGRFIDSLVGGVVGVLVMALLLPLNPLTTVQRAAGPALGLLADELDGVADALGSTDLDRARTTLDRMRSSEGELARFREALLSAHETASLAPVRWRARAPLSQYTDGAVHIDRAIRNGRVLARRAVSMLDDGEVIRAELLTGVRTLADAVRMLRKELAHGVEPKRTREMTLEAVKHAAEAYRLGLGFSGTVVVAQVRSTSTDLLRASGLDESTAIRAVRRTVGRLTT
jgi:uncharacterized membrane protein YgaE (UPF0421/DUF939 family)